ncbi:estradiol 17-beta-dehydrogenase 2 [Trichonephila inaurata madagascariensis]|uniref:Estradiol 17-beta-dehydrogenase 2 n=1 Tax=Trichonephila inaurata madagascariensis TaxID=2747483 RepID=A0A8X7CIY6_9ARAC|nr:estradiol 17-beta-dehydrogenase 2 [Trichonephila inaurata madagascariensis]
MRKSFRQFNHCGLIMATRRVTDSQSPWNTVSRDLGTDEVTLTAKDVQHDMDNTLPRFRVSSSNKAVFVTGCDKGFGRLLAIRLDSLGYKVFAGCLEPEGKEAQKLKDVVSNNLEIIPLDVTQVDSVQNALEVVESKLGCFELWAVVNNAGVIERGEVEWTPLEVYRKHFEVNVFGVVSVTQAFLPLLRKFKGRVVTVTSIAGRLTFSGLVPYSMSKHAARSFCEGLRLEMKKFGVKVITVEPFAHRYV